mmetsp:Transcript_11559/g.49291  ORF Transcript_11559/g.49291 Transcript_11559/m.49291 type:complete len:298 (+) Transcript_11559:477-1370(+)
MPSREPCSSTAVISAASEAPGPEADASEGVEEAPRETTASASASMADAVALCGNDAKAAAASRASAAALSSPSSAFVPAASAAAAAAFSPATSIAGAWRITAHVSDAAAAHPGRSRGRSLASITRPLCSAVRLSKTASESPRFLACGVSTGAAGSLIVPARPSSRKSRRRAIAAGASAAMPSSTCRSMSSTSRSRHIPSSIMMRAARSGSCSRRRPPPSVPSDSSRPAAPFAAPSPFMSTMGLGARMLEKGTRPRPSSVTNAVGARASLACGATSRNVSGAKGSRSFDLLVTESQFW